MPKVAFESLPSDARVWVFAADRTLTDTGASALLAAVDEFLGEWNAHGSPLTCARVLRDDRFLAVGVDQSAAGASGCSIDGLFRTLRRIEPDVGANLLSAGRVFWRDVNGAIESATRAEFSKAAKEGRISRTAPVFDTAVTDAAAWRDGFERVAGESWAKVLF